MPFVTGLPPSIEALVLQPSATHCYIISSILKHWAIGLYGYRAQFTKPWTTDKVWDLISRRSEFGYALSMRINFAKLGGGGVPKQ